MKSVVVKGQNSHDMFSALLHNQWMAAVCNATKCTSLSIYTKPWVSGGGRQMQIDGGGNREKRRRGTAEVLASRFVRASTRQWHPASLRV